MPIADVRDTIVALASAPGPGKRAIIRISGPEARRIAGTVFDPADALLASRRCRCEGQLQISGIESSLPADVYLWPAPRSYTAQDVIELHTISCPPLLDRLIGDILNHGCRSALPGEFTLRAFVAGKLDLPRAEAVLGVIEAGSRQDLKDALTQLAGGMTQPLEGLRENLLDLLADVEAGLDFTEEGIQFVDREALLCRLAKGLAQLTLAQKQFQDRAITDRPFRVVLVGRPNVGKSSLFNALTGGPSALVSAHPGTTRDYLIAKLQIKNVMFEIVDTAGWREASSTIEGQAQALGRDAAEAGDLLLLCLEAGADICKEENALLTRPGSPRVSAVATKCDVAIAPAGLPATSARTGAGIDALLRVASGSGPAPCPAGCCSQPEPLPSSCRCVPDAPSRRSLSRAL